MDAPDVVAHLAQAEARRLRAIRDPADLSEYALQLPCIVISGDGPNRLIATGVGHEAHENAGRMPFLCDFLNRRVLPMVDPAADVRGAYRIELHDSYSYLPHAARYQNALGFARPKGARESVALMPDPFHIGNFGGLLGPGRADVLPWEAKNPLMFFAGTTTGNRDPTKNERIQACVWSLGRLDVARFHITSVAQMSADAALAAVPLLRATLHPPVQPEDHFQFRYQVNIAGNTACWSRVPMIMASKCLMLNLKQPDVMWYYPALAEGTHFFGAATLDDLPNLQARCEADPARCRQVVANANRFVDDFLGPTQAPAYMVRLLEEAAWRGAP
jgi:hypothetical protein